MKTVNVTFSLPLDVRDDLKMYVEKRGMSQFVAKAIRKYLEEEKRELEKAYMQANEDPGQKEANNDWNTTIKDGIDDEW
ncbi:MAG: metal-responsive CopG/Arc/MetJ family transcriptional regulator [Chlamydiales bacterium]|jgi:metal-responsive CopG/Arc/MetJ family transcriptional regulator